MNETTPPPAAPPAALRALAAIAGIATLAVVLLLFAGPPAFAATVPAWAVFACAGTLLTALIALELHGRGLARGLLPLLAKLGFGVLVVVALFLLAQVLTAP